MLLLGKEPFQRIFKLFYVNNCRKKRYDLSENLKNLEEIGDFSQHLKIFFPILEIFFVIFSRFSRASLLSTCNTFFLLNNIVFVYFSAHFLSSSYSIELRLMFLK